MLLFVRSLPLYNVFFQGKSGVCVWGGWWVGGVYQASPQWLIKITNLPNNRPWEDQAIQKENDSMASLLIELTG